MIFKDMTELLHDDCINDVSIEHFEITQKDLRAIFKEYRSVNTLDSCGVTSC